MTLRLVTLLLLFISFSGFRFENWRHHSIGNSSGLSNSAVTSLFQDSRGYMWFGTWDGLNKYDGSEIKVYKPNAFKRGAISNNIIRGILEDKYKNLWFVTEDGVNLYNATNDSFVSYLTSNNKSVYREMGFHAALDHDSTLWCSKFNYGIVKYDINSDDFSDPVEVEGMPSLLLNVVGMGFSLDELLWVIHENGTISALQNQNGKWIMLTQINMAENHQIDPSKNWFIVHQNKSCLFFSLKDGGLLAIDLGQKTVSKITDYDIHVTALSNSLNNRFIWGGTDDGRLFQLTLNQNHFIHFFEIKLKGFSEKGVKIWSVYETPQDLFWVGTDGNGVHKFIMKNNHFIQTGKGDLAEGKLNHNIVRSIYEDINGNVWVGTRGKGLNIIQSDGRPTRIYDIQNGLSNNAVLSLARDYANNYWVGTDGQGIDMIESKTGRIYHFPRDFVNSVSLDFGSVYAICVDVFGNIWLGTSGYGFIKMEVRKISDGKYILKNYKQYLSDPDNPNGLQSNIVYSIINSEPNILWVGTRGGGLYRFNTLLEKFEVFRSNPDNINSLCNDDVLSLFKSDKEEIWIGTSGGLNRLVLSNPNYKFFHYSELNGLPNNSIHAIQGDGIGNIWMSTNKGLAKLNPQTGVVRSYFASDGLQDNEYSDGASHFGKFTQSIYFGGVNGFDKFNPAAIDDSQYFPPLEITDFELTNVAVNDQASKYPNIAEVMTLKHNQNFFKISFTTLNYHNKSKCLYEYKLDNFDQNFVRVQGNGEAYFTNVPSGTYTFYVRSTNEDGIWNPQTKKLSIIITPPFWKTQWAYLGYIVFLFFLVGVLIFLIARRAHIKNERAMEYLAIQKEKELQQYKFQFFTNIAHEFRTPLTLIMAPAVQLMDKLKDNTDIGPYVKSIYNNSNRLMHLIRELIDFRKVETGHFSLKVSLGDMSYFVSTITDAFKQYAEQKNIKLEYESSDNPFFAYFDSSILEKILLNLISNAIKFTPQGGAVSVKLSRHQQFAKIEVQDNGIGIPEHYHHKIFECFYHLNDSFPDANKKVDSSGVGLSLTKSLVELHHGTLHLNSEVGSGSCFMVTIPVNEDAYEAIAQEAEMIDEGLMRERAGDELIELSVVPFNSDSGKQMNATLEYTVLVVDDNDEIRNLITEVLRHEYNILQACNAKSAIEIIENSNIHAIVSDILMPGMNGLELCKSIKENIHTCHIPVILLTAKGDIEHRIEGIESGADSYIPKPFNPRHLKIRIRMLIQARIQFQKTFQEWIVKGTFDSKGLNSRDTKFLEMLQSFVDSNTHKFDLDADQLASHLAMSKTQLYRKVKAVTGYTPHGFIKNYRLKKSANLILESKLTVSEIIYETGFNNRTYFYKSFKELFGVTPTEYVQQKKDNI